ncbi:hypothetical protein CEUSTIGMA_g9480.t1 [Chlamydomonas eustigma]|uniref:ACT domain-containing protein n=1 Tax=Chlamydomonas eustigma TaxID=1157962 RepID=A0A250XGK4_9CHLO|nr:hypothetical protein CEUSTIGMA_g9480.t1 [Chlamydomonas eustigma]|eukprot:GAX82052.1 hypothetical protein CEUSTIGMA_g9480.t1 [Chlamydomonas eustigma]
MKLGTIKSAENKCAVSKRPVPSSGKCNLRFSDIRVQRHHRQATVLGLASPSLSLESGSNGRVEERTADVYVREPIPLQEGEEKHVISIFVADESGLINRVAGVFGRRGANIESLAVGLTRDKALFTIVVNGTQNTIANLVKQLSKLVKVRYVEDITNEIRIERELLLLKLAVPVGPIRTEVMQIAEIFRCKVVDVSDSTLTLCVTGDPGKCAAAEKTMRRYGILEMARTGRICLKRGANRLEPDFRVPESTPTASSSREQQQPISRNGSGDHSETGKADLFSVDGDDMPGVWDIKTVSDILEPTFGDINSAELASPHAVPGDSFVAHTLNIDVQDIAGVLNQVTGVFARRGYNIQSLAVGPSERSGMSRICMLVPGTEESISKLFKQLSKLVYVQKMVDLTHLPFIKRELLLVKVSCTAAQRGEVRNLAEIFRADILDVSSNSMIIEIVGKEDKLKALTDLLEPYGVMEIARTGRIALPRESGLDNEYLQKMVTTRVF